mmetsp:Transcript_5353/g.12274  ORF Transcript_5353/g.12274 Transcript_5353/m.12274 type:complete len:228 (-) Transcript_5353:173-856(-)
MIGCSVILVIISLLKGGKNGGEFVVCGTPGYWALKLSSMPILLCAAYFVSRLLLRRHALKEQVGYEFHPSEVKWTTSTTTRWPALCVCAGVAAGMLGIGGGILKGPIMIEMGVPPPVVAATAAYMLLFTCASTTVQFAALDMVLWDYAIALGVTGMLASLAAQLLIKKFVAAHHFQWPITALIGLVILLSTIFMGIAGVMATFVEIEDGDWVGPKPLCGGDVPMPGR